MKFASLPFVRQAMTEIPG